MYTTVFLTFPHYNTIKTNRYCEIGSSARALLSCARVKPLMLPLHVPYRRLILHEEGSSVWAHWYYQKLYLLVYYHRLVNLYVNERRKGIFRNRSQIERTLGCHKYIFCLVLHAHIRCQFTVHIKMPSHVQSLIGLQYSENILYTLQFYIE